MSRYHLIGVGGAGMSAVAELLAGQGHTVSGSDLVESATTTHLRQVGVEVWTPQGSQEIPADATVIVSSAIRPDNPEYRFAKERGLEIWHRSVGLAHAAQGKKFVAVAGAHGKTTTSAMLATALAQAGAAPSFAVGSAISGFGTGAHVGAGDVFVAEADESDGSFLNYHPTCALVTNIEADHLDHFGGTEALNQAFRDFVDTIIVGGTLVCCADDPGARALATYGKTRPIEVMTYGLRSPESGGEKTSLDVSASEISFGTAGSSALVHSQITGEQCRLEVPVSGTHNLLNALGAVTAGISLGLTLEQMCRGVASFHGTARRFELRGESHSRRVFDDYAHHPTEVEAALRQARMVAEEGRVVAVFQPHLYSRTLAFAGRFAQALALADQVFLLDIYRAREDHRDDVTSALIQTPLQVLGKEVEYVPGRSIAETMKGVAQASLPGDVVVLLGAGDINTGAESLLETWRAQ